MNQDEKNLYAFQAQELRRLADKFDQLAQGTIKPHTEEAKIIGYKAKYVIRFLVEDWL